MCPEAKHKKRAQALTAVNAVINRCSYPNPYTVVVNDDGTFKDGEDYCRCPVFMKLAYCKHTIASQ